MGIRPSLYLAVVLRGMEFDNESMTFQGESGEVKVDWENWEDEKIPLPTADEISLGSGRFADLEGDAYLDEMERDAEIWMAVVFDGQSISDRVLVSCEYPPYILAFKVTMDGHHDDSILWALAGLHPEESGYIGAQASFVEMPVVPPDDNCSEDAQWWKLHEAGKEVPYPRMVQRFQRTLDRGHNYVVFTHFVSSYLAEAKWFFERGLGLKVNYNNLRLGLVWTWG